MKSHKKAKLQLPRSSRVVFGKVREVLRMGRIDIPTEGPYGGTGAPGRMLETLLGIDENNNDSPDLLDWEIKFHGGGGSLLTLFHKEPQPRGILNDMVDAYGWPDNKGRISFRHTLGSESSRGFYVVNEDNRIVVHNRNKEKDIVSPYWTRNILFNTVGAKLRRLILVEGQDVDDSLKNLALGVILDFVTTHTLKQCEKVNEIKEAVRKALRGHVNDWGIKLINVYITDLDKHRAIRLLGVNE